MGKAANVSDLLKGQKIVPVVIIENESQALGLAQALIDGGINVIEVTLRNDYGMKAIELIKQRYPDMLVLAGTVNTSAQMVDVIEAGADGIVSPGITTKLLETAQEQAIPYLPGVSSASDVLLAMEYGLTECKLFPATVVGGMSALKAFKSPFSTIQFCPTGGVNEKNFKEFLALPNVMCVGGSWVSPTDLIESENWAEITRLCENAVA